jgi:hypothetical protein
LYIQDFNAQQTVSIDLGRIRGHGSDNVALGLDRLVALKTDQVGNGLARPQIWHEIDAFVAGAKSGNRKKQQPGNPL